MKGYDFHLKYYSNYYLFIKICLQHTTCELQITNVATRTKYHNPKSSW